MRWQHLDAEDAPIKHGARYEYLLSWCKPITGIVQWDVRYGYVIYPDGSDNQKYSLPFEYKSGQVLKYPQLKKERGMEDGKEETYNKVSGTSVFCL